MANLHGAWVFEPDASTVVLPIKFPANSAHQAHSAGFASPEKWSFRWPNCTTLAVKIGH